MPVDPEIAGQTWARFRQARDSGHDLYCAKADLCDQFFRGQQWRPADKARLEEVRRPAMTVNKILPTLLTVCGEQIYNRAEISFRPRGAPNEEVSTALTKVFKQIADNNQLDWRRSEMFADGAITSRGFLDVRMDYGDSVSGEVRISTVNPKNVVIDPDAEDYDPDTWSDVMVSKWVTADDIALLYNPADAEILRARDPAGMLYGVDAIDVQRDRFGRDHLPVLYSDNRDLGAVLRNVRIIDRQHRRLDRQQHFVDRQTGDTRPIPEDFERDRIAWFVQQFGLGVTTRLVRRIRWTSVAGDVVLHDQWSPYEHLTIVPYFPVFRHGHTVGFVENLTGPQEILNKVLSQELHVVNTTANSGYKVKSGALANMTVEELEQKGAQTGIVIEVTGDPDKDVQKIQPNVVPQGLERISYKAEESIKTISGINDSMLGMDREDVAGKAIERKKQSGATGLAKPMDNLTRTDTLLARHILSLVQNFYTQQRILTITRDSATGEHESIAVNQYDAAAGRIVNDLTLGEYDVIVTSVPHRETLEDSEFEQALALRQLGVAIPDAALVQSSRLRNKSELIRQLQGSQDSPQAQAQAQLQQRARQAEVDKLEGEAAQKRADARLKVAKAQKEGVLAQKEAATPPGQLQPPEPPDAVAQAAQLADMDRQERQFAHQRQMDHAELALKAQDMAQQRRQESARQAQQAAAALLTARAARRQRSAPTSPPTKGK